MLSDLEIPLGDLQTEAINQWLREQKNLESWEFGTDIANKLSDDQKSLLKLFYIDNRPCRDIARQMGATEIAIRKRLSRTRQQLKTELLEGGKNMNSMIAVSAVCAFLLGSVLSASGGTWRDDFEDGNLKDWAKYGQWNDGLWEVKDGVLACKNNNDFAVLYPIITETTWGNYTVTFDGKIKSHQGRYALAGSIRYDEEKEANAYYCIAGADGLDRIEASVYIAGKCFGIIRNHKFSLKLDKWYNFKATVNETQFDFFLDNELVVSVDWSNQPLPKRGKIDIWTRYPGEYHFDNFVVTGDDVPNTGYSIESKGKLTNTWGRIKQAD